MKDNSEGLDIGGHRLSVTKCILSGLGMLFSGGILLVLISWRQDIKMKCLYSKTTLRRAQKVLVKDKFNQMYVEDVIYEDDQGEGGGVSQSKSPPYFINKKIKFVWDERAKCFTRLSPIDTGMRFSDFHAMKGGLSGFKVMEQKTKYGSNLIKISVPPVMFLLTHEALNPFYLFQIYTVTLWSIQNYWKFASVIAVTSVISLSISVWETRRQNRNLREKMKSESVVSVLRDGKCKDISSQDLMPGDICLLSTCSVNFSMECDAVLIEGTGVVNESMLTGESVPVSKVALPNEEGETFEYDRQRNHVIFCGTQILQCKSNIGAQFCKAVVIRTGFMTTKGELVRSIMFPPPLNFEFHSDFLKSIYVFFALGFIGMIYSFYMWIDNGATFAEILLNSLDILTFIVSPMLPAALTANNAFAQKRLKQHDIYCLHSKHICLCGGIDTIAFDKTGTLTKSGLDLAGVVECKKSEFGELVTNINSLTSTSPLIRVMANCHSLISVKGELAGNPLDIKLFQSIKWKLREVTIGGVNPDYNLPTPVLVGPITSSNQRSNSNMTPIEFAIVKTYPFDSAVQRLTVVSTQRGQRDKFIVFVKGAPEKIESLCTEGSLPQAFRQTLDWYAQQGLRVIGAATKTINAPWNKVSDLKRHELEQDCQFVGLIIMQNLVKSETYGAIKELHDASIHTVMVTGDNLLTAISVGRDCKLISKYLPIIQVHANLSVDKTKLNIIYSLDNGDQADPHIQLKKQENVYNGEYGFACDGKTFGLIRKYDSTLFEKVVHRGKIFARMLPDQKIELIQALKDIGRQVMMCGDGCNDCGALKTAHAGISLSMAEASVAAPFTSRRVHIGCVPYLLREGRATMVSAFASFKFGVSFSFTQLTAVLMVYYIATEPSDDQYLIADIGLAALPIIFFGNSFPSAKLGPRAPSRHLLSFIPLFSTISFLFFQTVFYVVVWFLVQNQEWFTRFVYVKDKHPPNPSYEQTYTFLMSCMAPVIAAIIFCKGAPYRKSIFNNVIMVSWTVVAIITVIFMTLYDTPDFASRLNFKIAPTMHFRLIVVSIMFSNLVFCYIWEILFLDTFLFTIVLPWYKKEIRGPVHQFEMYEEELKSRKGWPPIANRNQSIAYGAATVVEKMGGMASIMSSVIDMTDDRGEDEMLHVDNNEMNDGEHSGNEDENDVCSLAQMLSPRRKPSQDMHHQSNSERKRSAGGANEQQRMPVSNGRVTSSHIYTNKLQTKTPVSGVIRSSHDVDYQTEGLNHQSSDMLSKTDHHNSSQIFSSEYLQRSTRGVSSMRSSTQETTIR